MAPKTFYDAGEVPKKVTETAEKVFETLKEEGWEFSESTQLTCEFLGAATPDGYSLDKKPALRCTVGFKWSYCDESTNESLTKRVRYDYYLSHGITFPEHWKTAFKCDFLSRIAQEAAVRFAQESAFEDVSCRFAGAPLPVEVYTDGRIAAGSILKTAWSGILVEHVLCAHVCEQTWLCHRGSFTGDALSMNPFGETDLAPIDLSTDLWYEGQERPRKRIRAHLPVGHLADLSTKHDRALNALVARAQFEAEVLRANTLHVAVDESRALAGYDPNPFNWTGGTIPGPWIPRA